VYGNSQTVWSESRPPDEQGGYLQQCDDSKTIHSRTFLVSVLARKIILFQAARASERLIFVIK
jgi:hypothetical protein